MRQTPLFNQHLKLGASMINLKDVARPVEYASHSTEHHATRTAVTLCDVSHMGELTFTGKDAARLLQYLVVGNVDKLTDGKAMYSAFCNEQGHVTDDMVLMRLAADRFLMVVNVTMVEKDFQWVLARARDLGTLDVEVCDVSCATALMALQGPYARDTLQKVTRAKLDTIPYYSVVETEIATLGGGVIPCVISRTGYTGELGFEICVARDGAPFIWEELMRVGQPFGIMGHGVAARESLRTEAGLLLNGNDMDGKTTPYEAGIGWTVDLNIDFVGKKALVTAKAAGPAKCMVGLVLDGMPTMRHGYAVYEHPEGGNSVGTVTSGPLGCALTGKSLGLAYVRPELAKPGQDLYVDILGDRHAVTVTSLPFLPRRSKDALPPRTMSPFALSYLNAHIWLVPSGTNRFVVGITDYAQNLLGEILYFKPPVVGHHYAASETLGYTDSYRCVFPLTLPIDCTVVSVNESLITSPADINRYPYHLEGLFTIELPVKPHMLQDFRQHVSEVSHLKSYAVWITKRRTV